jgi:hypothetical protein
LITGHITIRNNSIILDGKNIFASESGLEEFLLKAYEQSRIDYPKYYKMDTLSKAGFLAAELLLKEHPLKTHLSYDTAIVLSNNHSSLDTDKRYQRASEVMASPALFVYTLPNIVAGEIAIRHKIKGENAFFISERFDARLMTEYVHMMFNDGPTKACLTGWVDVMAEHHDVFLYLIEKSKSGAVTPDEVLSLYKSNLWNN